MLEQRNRILIMNTIIEIHCRQCKEISITKRSPDIPAKADYIACNWCPACEDRAKDYWKEWFVTRRKRKQLTDKIKQPELF